MHSTKSFVIANAIFNSNTKYVFAALLFIFQQSIKLLAQILIGKAKALFYCMFGIIAVNDLFIKYYAIIC